MKELAVYMGTTQSHLFYQVWYRNAFPKPHVKLGRRVYYRRDKMAELKKLWKGLHKGGL